MCVRERATLALAGFALALGCATDGTFHIVRRGENLYRISQYYEVPVQTIARASGVEDVSDLTVGQGLWIPDARREQPWRRALTPPRGAQDSASPTGRAGAERVLTGAQGAGALRFRWPVKGRVSSRFGRRWGRLHEGLDVAARSGTKIRSAEAGRVIHAGWLGAYGRVVIVQHTGGFSTVYAHNKKNHVRKGERVKRGAVIAEVGSSGRSTGPHLHFEIRRKDRPLDPLQYLK